MRIRKVYGILVCIIGIVLVNWSRENLAENIIFTLIYFSGIFISFAGIALFASGLKKRVIEKIKICPVCFYKNSEKDNSCKKCGTNF